MSTKVAAGDFNYDENGIFYLISNRDVRIDAKKSIREIEDSLKRQGYYTKNPNGFHYQLRNRAGLIKNKIPQTDITQIVEPVSGPAFEMERHLRDWIAYNIEDLDIIHGRKLKLYKDGQGIEYKTAVGNIDILAIDDNKSFIVFELKLSKGTNSAVGQIQTYMSWIKEKLAGDKEVKGVIMASDIDDKLRYAVKYNHDITLIRYSLDFKIEEIN